MSNPFATPTPEEQEMRDLVRRVGEELELEANFDLEEWQEDPEHYPIPPDILEEMPAGLMATDDEMRDELENALERWREQVGERVLDITFSGSWAGGEISISDTLTMVLGTGGPHLEIEIDSNGRGLVRAYGWWRSGESTYPINIDGHPYAWLAGEIVAAIEEQVSSRENSRW